MRNRPTVIPVAARRISSIQPSQGDASRRTRPTHRPLIVGAAILERPRGSRGPWYSLVSRDGRLLPIAPKSQEGVLQRVREVEDAGFDCRVTAALLAPGDLVPAVTWQSNRRPTGIEFYGWALLYQLPAARGIACVDAHDEFDELPAFYESPLELLDRAAYLAERGVATRPLVVVTHTGDLVGKGERRRRNRFFPDAVCRKQCDYHWLV